MMWNFTRVRGSVQRCINNIFRPLVISALCGVLFTGLWGCDDDEESQGERVPQINLGGTMGGTEGGPSRDHTAAALAVPCSRLRFSHVTFRPRGILMS